MVHPDRGMGKVTAIDWDEPEEAIFRGAQVGDKIVEKPKKKAKGIPYLYTVTYNSGDVQKYDAESAASKLIALGPTISTLEASTRSRQHSKFLLLLIDQRMIARRSPHTV